MATGHETVLSRAIISVPVVSDEYWATVNVPIRRFRNASRIKRTIATSCSLTMSARFITGIPAALSLETMSNPLGFPFIK